MQRRSGRRTSADLTGHGTGVNKLDMKPVVKTSSLNNSKPKHGYISAYEEAIQKNIKERMEMLRTLKIDAIKEEVKAMVPQPKKKVFKQVKKEQKILTPSRRSLRLSGRDPKGDVMPVRPATPPEPEVRKLGKESVKDTVFSGTAAEHTVRFIEDIRSWLAKQERRQDIPVDSYTQSLTSMEVTEDTWTKVTSQRITSLAFCPLQQKHVVAAGDKRGVLGLWDVARSDEGVHQLDAHGRHINGLSFSPLDGSQCYTTSYDGITRRLDMEKLEFDQVYATPDSEADLYITHHDHAGPHALLIGRSDGRLVRADLRSSEIGGHQLGDGCIRYVSVHPSREHAVVTVQKPSLVSLWDLRHVKGPRSVLHQIALPRACSGAAVSRRSGDLLVALSSDDTIRVYSGVNQGTLTPTKTIRHNNHTGRWLTTFKPTWLPNSDDLFLVGSMERPRRMEVYDQAGPVYHYLMGDEMQSVCSTIACHPTEPAVAGGNSSGRVYLFR